MSRNVVVGVTGGIACYKAADVVSRLKKEDIEVDVIMTENACEFVSPLTFRTLSKNPVVTSTFAVPEAWKVGHVALAQKADVMLIAPATANIIGKVANGIADDMLTTTIMASKAKIVFAPAMNVNMYENPILQENIAKLKRLGYLFIEPEAGLLACGDTGKGRMAEPPVIVDFVTGLLEIINSADGADSVDDIRELENIANLEEAESGNIEVGPGNINGVTGIKPADFTGKKILVTAGPTVEDIDPVRYISNRSSGKMGYAVAEAALQRGAEVILISGPVALTCSDGIRRVDVKTTKEMLDACEEIFGEVDAVIKAAAPADFYVADKSEHKIKKTGGTMSIELSKNPDILEALGKKKADKILVGFAAETRNLEEYAKEKMVRKNLDMIVANNVAAPGAGFDHDTNIITIMKAADGSVDTYDKMSKSEAAHVILDHVAGLLEK